MPMVVSVSALATGLAGIVATNDWRLLLVVAAATGLSEGIGLIVFSDVFNRNRKEIEERNAKMSEKLGGATIDADKMFAWADAVAAALVTFTTVAMTMILTARFSNCLADARWVKVCLFLGCACVPWCYRSKNANEHFRKWSVFAVAAFTSVWLMVFPGEPLLRAVEFALVLFPVHLIRQWRINRKGAEA